MSKLELIRQAVELAEQLEENIREIGNVHDGVKESLSNIQSWLEFRLSKAESNRYRTWPLDRIKPEDVPIFRDMWARVRRNPRHYQFRRDLAHDYALAKCSKRKLEAIQ